MRNAGDNRGKRSAVRNNSGEPVHPSGPGLGVGRTSPSTAGRKPEACPAHLRAGDQPALSQHKTGREPEGGALGVREAHGTNLDAHHISDLRQFFELLDRWDREATRASKAM